MVDFAPIGFSDVALTKSVLEEKREFIPSEAEWKARNEVQIIESAGVGEESSTLIYTVPEKKHAFLTNVWMTLLDEAGTGRLRAELEIRSGSAVRRRILVMGVDGGSKTTQTLALALPMPIKLFEGETIHVDTTLSSVGADGRAEAGVIGWEENKEVLQQVAPQVS